MHRTMVNAGRVLLIILLIFSPILLAAQQGDEPSIDADWDDFFTDLYARGDQTFLISMGVTFPTLFYFFNNNELGDPQFTGIGGTGSLNYNYYLNSKLFLGGEVSGMFISSLTGNSLFIVPLGMRVGTQFIVNRFEFPVSLSFGMVWQTYLNFGYYGFYLKAGGGAYFRVSSDWSFGLTTDWAWFPQWTDDPAKNVDGNFIYLRLSARYHF